MKIDGVTNIKTIRTLEGYIKIELVNLSKSESFIDCVEIPNIFITNETLPVIIEQMLSNDLKNVGYRYTEHVKKEVNNFKTMPQTQIVGTMKLILNEISR